MIELIALLWAIFGLVFLVSLCQAAARGDGIGGAQGNGN
jgi:hypothetical protein